MFRCRVIDIDLELYVALHVLLEVDICPEDAIFLSQGEWLLLPSVLKLCTQGLREVEGFLDVVVHDAVVTNVKVIGIVLQRMKCRGQGYSTNWET